MAFYQRQPDIIIRNGTIVDGTGKLPYFADIAMVCIDIALYFRNTALDRKAEMK